MKLFLLLFLSAMAFAAGWETIYRIQPDQKIEVITQDRAATRVVFVAATEEAMVVRDHRGERSIARSEIRQVRVADPSRRLRDGLLWTAIGAAAGVGIGAAICPSCANEGHGGKFVGPGAAIGAGVGALGFLPAPYRKIYEVN